MLVRSSNHVIFHFYPRPPRGGRLRKENAPWTLKSFLSTPSARRATGVHFFIHDYQFISIHALREEGDDKTSYKFMFQGISIHALREEGDLDLGDQDLGGAQISIHALREEGDFACNAAQTSAFLFLSTPSARRATSGLYHQCFAFLHFYPRPPRGGRRDSVCAGRHRLGISIHALREEGDGYPCRRLDFSGISIHALREEGDISGAAGDVTVMDFYPRPPRGGRHCFAVSSFTLLVFLSTPSARRATPLNCCLVRPMVYFYPRPPRGGRRRGHREHSRQAQFLSTPSARRATAKTEKNISAFVSL